MTDKVTLGTITSFVNDTSAANVFNNNMALLTTAMDNTLSRDGTSPNQMGSSLDMNNNQILNLPAPASISSPARLKDVVSNSTITVPPVGTSGGTVPLLNGNNTWSGTNVFTKTTTTKEYISVTDFGADSTGIVDSSAAFQSAFNAASSGASIHVPNGTYLVQTTITSSASNICLYGDGPGSVISAGSNTTTDIFQLSGLSDLEIRSLTFISGLTKTAGAFLNFSSVAAGAGNYYIHNCWFTGGYAHIVFTGTCQNTFIDSCTLAFFTGHGIIYGASYIGLGFVSNCQIQGVFSGPHATTGFGIIAQNGDGFLLSNLNVQNCNSGIAFIPGAAGFIRNPFAVNVFSDTGVAGGGAGWTFDGSAAGAEVTRVKLLNCWAGGGPAEGFVFHKTLDACLTNCHAIDNGASGFHLLGGGTTNIGIRFSNCIAEGNGLSSVGSYPGFLIETGSVNHLQMLGCRSGPTSAGVSNSQSYGVFFGSVSGFLNIVMIGNDFTGNVTGAVNTLLSNASSGVIKNNTGLNPVGTQAVVAMGASPFVYTAGPYEETHYLNQNGTQNGVVTKNGVQIINLINPATFYPILLEPNESYTVTYTTTIPGYIKDVH